MKFFSSLRRTASLHLTVLKRSHKSRPSYSFNVLDPLAYTDLKQVEDRVRHSPSERQLSALKKGQFMTDADAAGYEHLHDFVADVRGCLSGRIAILDGTMTGDWTERDSLIKTATVIENYLSLWFPHAGGGYPELCVGWTTCLEVLKAMLQFEVQDPNTKKRDTPARWFKFNVTSFFQGNWPPGYLEKVKRPSSFSHVTRDIFCCKIR